MFSRKIQWYYLFDEDELKSKFLLGDTYIHKGMFGEVLLVKQVNEYYAFKSKCPHQNKSLEGCAIDDGMVVCPHHRYGFSLENGRGQGLYLDKYELKFENGGVYLGKEKWAIF